MVYFNADGNESSMCGNGGRCLTQFAFDMGIKKENYRFIAVDGDHEAFFEKNGWVDLKMKNVTEIKQYQNDKVLNTGSPHYIQQVINLKTKDVFADGRAIRYNNDFTATGINVNFVEPTTDGIAVRTYERGVENETLSCGTGVTASALVFSNNKAHQRVNITTIGGNLAVEFDKQNAQTFSNIYLCGPATFVFKGEIEI